MDPISLLGIATTAFTTIKKGFEFGRDAESMIKDIGRFMHSIDDLKHTHDKSKKKKFGSVEEESLETYVALKKARKMDLVSLLYVNPLITRCFLGRFLKGILLKYPKKDLSQHHLI